MSGIPLGPYRLQAQLGRGGMGSVWRAAPGARGLPVAVKVMLAGSRPAPGGGPPAAGARALPGSAAPAGPPALAGRALPAREPRGLLATVQAGLLVCDAVRGDWHAWDERFEQAALGARSALEPDLAWALGLAAEITATSDPARAQRAAMLARAQRRTLGRHEG